MDRIHQEVAQEAPRYTTYRNQAYTGDSQNRGRVPSQSPRRRHQSPRARHQGGAANKGGKGKGNKAKGEGKDDGPNKGQSKGQHQQKGYMGQDGMAPLPPPPIPSYLDTMDTSWMQPPPPFDSGKANAVPDGPLQAESKLRKVMGVLNLKQNETELPPDVARILKDTPVKDDKLKIKGMRDAVEELGHAHAALKQALREPKPSNLEASFAPISAEMAGVYRGSNNRRK